LSPDPDIQAKTRGRQKAAHLSPYLSWRTVNVLECQIKIKMLSYTSESLTMPPRKRPSDSNSNSNTSQRKVQKTTNTRKEKTPPVKKQPRKKQADYITQWTIDSYQNIQNARRKGYNIGKEGKQINRYLAQYFRNTGIRAPYRPKALTIEDSYTKNNAPKKHKYLYRGLHGPLAEEFIRDGSIDDEGYVAFSIDPITSYGFSIKKNELSDNNNNNSHRIVLRLPIDSVPKGTPWLWYNSEIIENIEGKRRKGTNAYKSFIAEGEVLLPPGMLWGVRNRPINNTVKHRKYPDLQRAKIYDVQYIPSVSATSIDGKRLHRLQSSVRQPRHTSKQRRVKNISSTPINNITTWFSKLFS
jgi:hypothetical protein